MADRAPIRAAGVVVVDGHDRVVVVHRPGHDDLSLPKGKHGSGELAPVAAVRECREETGILVRLGVPLGTCSYAVDGVPKRVRYWRAEPLDVSERRPDDEVDEVRHVPLGEVGTTLTYPADTDLVERAVALGPTRPLVVLRHAEAQKRAHWSASGAREAHDDHARPITPDGLRQADALVPLLAAYGVTDLRSSSARRCRQTIEPYAAAHGIVVVRDERLSEEGHRDDPAATAAAVRDALESPDPTALCTHRPVLHAVVRTLVDCLDVAAGADLDLTELLEPRLETAAMLVLHRDRAGLLVAVEHHHVL